MLCRQLAKLQRYAFILLSYVTVYIIISYAIAPEVSVSFVSDNVRVGDKFVLIYLVAPKSPPFAEPDGAAVFHPRCGKCYLTNNRGFMPLSEYDAVLTSEDRQEFPKEKMYVLEATRKCLRDKLTGCVRAPRVTSPDNRKYDLCSLCEHLHAMRVKV